MRDCCSKGWGGRAQAEGGVFLLSAQPMNSSAQGLLQLKDGTGKWVSIRELSHGENRNSVCIVLLACRTWAGLFHKWKKALLPPGSTCVAEDQPVPWSLRQQRTFVNAPRSEGQSFPACGVSLEDLKLSTKNNDSGLLCELGKLGDLLFASVHTFSSLFFASLASSKRRPFCSCDV